LLNSPSEWEQNFKPIEDKIRSWFT